MIQLLFAIDRFQLTFFKKVSFFYFNLYIRRGTGIGRVSLVGTNVILVIFAEYRSVNRGNTKMCFGRVIVYHAVGTGRFAPEVEKRLRKRIFPPWLVDGGGAEYGNSFRLIEFLFRFEFFHSPANTFRIISAYQFTLYEFVSFFFRVVYIYT